MEAQRGFAAELRVIPRWTWVAAGLVILVAEAAFDTVLAHQPDAPPAWACAALGLMAGVVLGCYLLFIGYVSRDARRRGMSAVLWTLVAILIPNGLGILLYFLLRQPLHVACPSCGNLVQTDFTFCPRCSYKLG